MALFFFRKKINLLLAIIDLFHTFASPNGENESKFFQILDYQH